LWQVGFGQSKFSVANLDRVMALIALASARVAQRNSNAWRKLNHRTLVLRVSYRTEILIFGVCIALYRSMGVLEATRVLDDFR